MSNFHGLKSLAGIANFCSMSNEQSVISGQFGRMFHELPALYTDPSILSELGRPGGNMDGGSQTDRTDTVAVGMVFFGQLVDHDITLDTSSSFTSVNTATDIKNVRTPALDLDCVYGSGPEASPFMYVQSGEFKGVKLLTGADVDGADNKVANDLVRSIAGTAIIGDPRNDENRIVSQLQLGMIRFHNEVAETLASKYSGDELFEEAKRTVIYHYHWAVLYDYLAAMCGSTVVWDILKNGRQHYCTKRGAYIPVEFSVAAYRYGHSMAPQEIQINKGDSSYALFGSVLGGGFKPLSDERAIVDMHEIFETSENRQVQKAEKLDTKLAKVLLDLPFITEGESSLATRNLLRGQSFLLPAGEVVAAHMGRSESEIAQVSDKANTASGNRLAGKTPLWFYILAEAEVIGKEVAPGQFESGEGLGPIGARIVAEVIIGLMEGDHHSFLASNRSWNPAQGMGAKVSSVGEMLVYRAPN